MRHERIYLNENDKRVFIDTYVANASKKRDALLVIPGGGYGTVCTDREGEPIALDFFARGYNCFVLNYRCGTESDVYPAQITDAGAAMIYLREHADELKIDPERVFAVGFSAGGHLCGSLATMFAYPELVAAFGEKAIMIRPTGAILAYPVTVTRGNTHLGTFKNLLGKPLSEYTDGELDKFSIDKALSADSSPMFLWHTVEDQLVPVEGTLKLGLALTAKKIPYKMSIYPYGPHGIALGTEITSTGAPSVQPLADSWTAEADAWMRTVASKTYDEK